LSDKNDILENHFSSISLFQGILQQRESLVQCIDIREKEIAQGILVCKRSKDQRLQEQVLVTGTKQGKQADDAGGLTRQLGLGE